MFNGHFSIVHLVLGGVQRPMFFSLVFATLVILSPEPKACELFLADAVPVASEGSKVPPCFWLENGKSIWILWMDLDPTFVIDSDRSW